jgi:hypothetical protein
VPQFIFLPQPLQWWQHSMTRQKYLTTAMGLPLPQGWSPSGGSLTPEACALYNSAHIEVARKNFPVGLEGKTLSRMFNLLEGWSLMQCFLLLFWTWLGNHHLSFFLMPVFCCIYLNIFWKHITYLTSQVFH